MCAECEQITVELETISILAELDDAVIKAEIAAGLNVLDATRALSPDEIMAKVKFGEIAAITEDATLSATAALESLRAVIVSAITDELLGGADSVAPADAARGLAQLNAAQPAGVQSAVALTAAAIVGILALTAGRAGGVVSGEATRQGVKLGGWKPPAVPRETFLLPAAAAALHPWQRITSKLQTDLLAPGDLFKDAITREEIGKNIDKISLDGSVDIARQTIHAAQGIGRNAAAAELNPSEIFASEIMDGNTCPACKAVDMKEYASMEEARVEYEHGGYGACAGGARCRGTLVFLYNGPAPENDLPVPEPLPPIPAPDKPVPKVSPTEPAIPGAEPPKRRKGFSQRYDALDQLPPPNAAHSKAGTAGALDSARDANPGRDPKKPIRNYSVNCSSVVQAQEFRRRGYDVTAAPVPDGKGRFESEFVTEWWRNPDGTKPVVTSIRKLPAPAVPEGVDARRVLPNGSVEAQLKIAEFINSQPEGSRGFISLAWKSGGGHVFNWERIDGKPVFIEGQTGRPDASKHLDSGVFKPTTVNLVRVDNLVPTDLVTQALETRPAGYLKEMADKQAKADAKRIAEGKYAGWTALDKSRYSVWRMTMKDGKAIPIAPVFRKASNGRWEQIPDVERTAMEEKMKQDMDAGEQAK